jgi:hypothetical protein
MMNLASTSDVLRVVTSAAAQIEAHVSWVDLSGSTVTPSRQNTPAIVTATTTTIAPSPPASTVRNIKHVNITNDHPSQSCVVTLEHFDGTTAIELISYILLPGENMIMGEEGRYIHHDAQGAEYPPSGKGNFDGFSVTFFKTGTAADAAANWYCTAKDGGFPGAWSPGTPGVNGRVTNGTLAADNGCFPIRNPSLGANYLTGLEMAASVPHTHQFFDVLWVNTGLVVTTTTAQAIAMPVLPPRDINGTTTGEGCMIAMLFTAASTNAAAIANSTVTYTNSNGLAGRTARLIALAGSQIPATPVAGTLVWFNLDVGDKGVQSIQAVTLNTSLVTGSISMMITRDIATIGNPIANVGASKNIQTPGIRLYNDSCVLHCNLASNTTATLYSGELVIQEK